jgi:hypothetical protein
MVGVLIPTMLAEDALGGNDVILAFGALAFISVIVNAVRKGVL